MNLGPPASNALEERPHQGGHARGRKRGSPVSTSVEWMVDTGADIGTIQKSIGDQFDLTMTAATATATTGGVISIKSGLEVEFQAEDSVGTSHVLRSPKPVAVKPGNTGSNIIGMDQLSALSVEVEWKPAARKGTLRVHVSARAGTAPVLTQTAGSSGYLPTGIIDHGSWFEVDGRRLDKARLLFRQRPIF